MVRVLQVTLFLIIAASCSKQECIDHPSVEMKKVPVNRLEQAFGELKTKEEIKAYLDNHPDLKNGFLLGQQYPDSFMVDYLHQVNSTPASDTLYKECMATFGDFTAWRQQFEQAQSLLIHYYPQEKVREVNTFIPGLMRDLYVNDEDIFIGATVSGVYRLSTY